MIAAGRDRLEKLIGQDEVTGIDFVYVAEDQRHLSVHFLKAPGELASPLGAIARNRVQIRSLSDPAAGSVILASDPRWTDESEDVLELETQNPGGFGPYSLWIEHPQIDPYFNGLEFSFKASCPSDVDCRPRVPGCPPEAGLPVAIDYEARDFDSFRRALQEFAAQRYPEWEDRTRVADLGVMLLEIMSALGDEQSYYQDRVAREAFLETASERRSVRHHARLVDYRVHDGLGSRVWLDFTIKADGAGLIPAGLDVWAMSDSGTRIPYEVGRGLHDVMARVAFPVASSRNDFTPHVWDEDDTCLASGATELFVEGHQEDVLLPLEDGAAGGVLGRWMLLKTSPDDPGIPERTWMVRVISVENRKDPVFGEEISRLVWEPEQALPFEMDLATLRIRGNLVPAVSGRTEERRFVIRELPATPAVPWELGRDVARAIERVGSNGTVAFLFSLPGTDKERLVWLGPDVDSARPEICLFEERLDEASATWMTDANFALDCTKDPAQWCWQPSLVGVRSSQRYDQDFTLDDGTWARVVAYQRNGEEWVHTDYRGASGSTIRFGDGEFGALPRTGSVFRVVYRVGGLRSQAVAARTVTSFEADAMVSDISAAPLRAGDLIEGVVNPLASEGGQDAETADEVRQYAPDAFRSLTFRAVTERDYAEAAERLPWVQRAGARFRWTGSWLTAFVTPDPRDAVSLTEGQEFELANQLNRFRQTGRETYVRDPKYADLDLQVWVCVEPSAYQGQVKERVLEALLGAPSRSSKADTGFFAPDNFTFGTSLHRSALEAAIQQVEGVRAVGPVWIARRGWFRWRRLTELEFAVGQDEVIRVENDLRHPDRGSLKLLMEGGA